jgi:hypothetical protein
VLYEVILFGFRRIPLDEVQEPFNFQRLMAYIRDWEVMAMSDCDSACKIGLLVPYTHAESIGVWFYAPMKNLTLWTKLLANRIAADAEAEANAARFAVDAEAARIGGRGSGR